MSKRKSNADTSKVLFDILMLAPIWLGPVFAVVVFILLRFVFPALVKPDTQVFWTTFAGAGKVFAPFAAGLVIVAWIVAEVQKHSRRALLEKQSGVDSIRELSWQAFEHLVGEAYRRQGYAVEETGSTSGDGGVDLVLSKGKDRVLVQCKQWRAQKVGVKPVRELFGVLAGDSATRAILVTSGIFTQEAENFAADKPLELVDGRPLWKLIQSVQKSPSNAPADKATTPEKIADLHSPDVAAPAVSVPECPLCAAPMIRRTAKKGPHAGTSFWGCSKYPACRGTKRQD